eukprot:TRINITY_DN606_c0_g1_i4.p1 TRINITY_DN606_c0_g1~~TRINITY_DN606_c0_g1_i4.p1  ORF type:complete len:696 (+),score=61.84 TRINITY_DN606_c0_g1_i4:124-2088(+)
MGILRTYFTSLGIPLEMQLHAIETEPKNSIMQDLNIIFKEKRANQIQLTFEQITVQINDSRNKGKIILRDLNGSLEPGQLNVIMGPSGSGKTTFLNLVSGRLWSNKLAIEGILKLNGEAVTNLDQYGQVIGYVMQYDVLLKTFTPREAFKFAAQMRLNATNNECNEAVNAVISQLGLEKCADTKIGNHLVRGISGGEKKRTAIGVELITNPSLLFLDEPTTGLDSENSIHLLEILKKMAQMGKTIVSTLHQPSSDMYKLFDRLTLLVRGQILYQGDAYRAIDYFSGKGFTCPKLANPADYFLKLVDEDYIQLEARKEGKKLSTEELEEKVSQRLQHLSQNSYFASTSDLSNQPLSIQKKSQYQKSFFFTFYMVWLRTVKHRLRDPAELRVKTMNRIIMAIVLIIFFGNVDNGGNGVQNRNGLLYILATLTNWSGIQGDMLTFSEERPLFFRERMTKMYSTPAYFLAKNLSECPYQIPWPLMQLAIFYFAVGLNNETPTKFLIAVLITIQAFFASSGYGVLLSVIFPKVETALSMVYVIILPFMVCSGYFVSQDKIPFFFYPFQYLSPWKYAYQAYLINEYTDNTKLSCFSDNPPCDPLESLRSREGLWLSILILCLIGIVTRCVGALLISRLSKPPRVLLTKPKVLNNVSINIS